MQQINFDTAWQIFDQVNEENDTEQIIDLNCLDISDGEAITKQKIYDLAKMIREQGPSNKGNGHSFVGFQNDLVLCVVCSDDHFIQMKTQSGSAPLKNAILECVRNELQMDHYYIAQTKTILIRVNYETLGNPVLADY